jgi:hypothetical protein
MRCAKQHQLQQHLLLLVTTHSVTVPPYRQQSIIADHAAVHILHLQRNSEQHQCTRDVQTDVCMQTQAATTVVVDGEHWIE